MARLYSQIQPKWCIFPTRKGLAYIASEYLQRYNSAAINALALIAPLHTDYGPMTGTPAVTNSERTDAVQPASSGSTACLIAPAMSAFPSGNMSDEQFASFVIVENDEVPVGNVKFSKQLRTLVEI